MYEASKPMKGILFRPNQQPVLVEFTGWDDLLEHVGTDVLEPISLRRNLVAYVDEEARIRGTPIVVNHAATQYVTTVLAETDRVLMGGTIVNNMILVGSRHTKDGEVETDIPETVIKSLGL